MDGFQIVCEAVKKPIRDIVKDESWQKVRKSLLGQWNKRPTWCCAQIRSYLGPVSKASDDKLRIVMNYLTGTGFRTGRIKHPCIQSIRDSISKERKRRRK
jgi:hypothetical protein